MKKEKRQKKSLRKPAGEVFEWPFLDLPNTVVLAHTAVFRNSEPVLQVAHEEEDGAWQFLDGVSPVTFSAACMISLSQILRRDPTLAEIADLPLGWRATRKAEGKPWTREKLPEKKAEDSHAHHDNCPCCEDHAMPAVKKSRVRIRKAK